MANTTNFGWETPDDTDLVKDGAAAMRTLGNAIDASLVDLKGGTTNQVLAKNSNTDMDFKWVETDDTNAIQNAIVDAKGDLIAASAADTPARLAVGNNGDTLVADSSASTGLRWQGNFAAGKNAIINGDFRLNQRTFTSASGTQVTSYGFDRWLNSGSGGGTITYTAQTFTAGSAPVAGYEARNYLDIQTTGQTATNVTTRIDQRIESVRTFANQTITVSFWAKAASGTPKIAVELDQQFGTGGSPSSRVTTYAGQVTLSTSWARYSVTVAVPSISGKTLGTNGDDYLSLNLWFSAGTDFNARTGSLGIQTNTFSIWGVQVEAGSVASAFQTATGTLAGELAACQRYYWRMTPAETAGCFATGINISTAAAEFIVPNPVPMRTRATSVDWVSLRVLLPGTNAWNVTATTGLSLTTSQSTELVSYVQANVGSGLTQNQVVMLQKQNVSTAHLGFSAEL